MTIRKVTFGKRMFGKMTFGKNDIWEKPIKKILAFGQNGILEECVLDKRPTIGTYRCLSNVFLRVYNSIMLLSQKLFSKLLLIQILLFQMLFCHLLFSIMLLFQMLLSKNVTFQKAAVPIVFFFLQIVLTPLIL